MGIQVSYELRAKSFQFHSFVLDDKMEFQICQINQSASVTNKTIPLCITNTYDGYIICGM